LRKKVIYIVSDIDKALAFEWIADRIDESKVELSFILIQQRPSFLEAYLTAKGIPVAAYYYKGKKELLPIAWKITKLLNQLRPHVVHCHLFYGSFIGLLAARISGIKTRIYTRHHSDYHQRYYPKGRKWDKINNYLATDIVAPSGVVKDILIKDEKVPGHKVHLIHHGFDTTYFSEVEANRIASLKSKYNISESDRPVIGVISRFTELKGIQYIIPAFKKLLEQYPSAVLMLFNANGEYKPILESALATLPSNNYRVIEFENDLAAVYRLFTVFIQASTDRTIEAFGQTYVEALAAEVPSIFTLAGIAGDFIQDGKNAFVVPFKDIAAIFEKLCLVLNDYNTAKKIARQGKREVEELFSIDRMVHELENLYEQD
jgi:glycosyltransferase involved in cell wall biosynthesis